MPRRSRLTMPTAEQLALRDWAKRHWPTTNGGRKLICPTCRATGYPSGQTTISSWIDRHVQHLATPCGGVVAAGKISDRAALSAHSNRCVACKAVAL